MQIHSQYADFKFVGTPVNEEYITITVNRKLTVIKHKTLSIVTCTSAALSLYVLYFAF